MPAGEQFDPDKFMSDRTPAFDPDAFMADHGAKTKSFADHLADYWHMVNPVEQAQGVAQAAITPASTVMGHARGTTALYDKAVDSFKKGNYTDAARHALSYLGNSVTLGMMGGLDEAGNDLEEGRIGEGLTKTAAIATNVIAGKKLGDVTAAATEPGAPGNAVTAVKNVTAKTGAVVKAGVKASAPDVLAGGTKLAAGAALDELGAPYHVGTVMGVKEGAPQIGRGIVKGVKAGIEAYKKFDPDTFMAERAAKSATTPEQPASTETPAPAEQPTQPEAAPPAQPAPVEIMPSAVPNPTTGKVVPPQPVESTEPPASFLDQENAGLQVAPHLANRAAMADRWADYLGGTHNLPLTEYEWVQRAKEMGEDVPSAATRLQIEEQLNQRMIAGEEKPGASAIKPPANLNPKALKLAQQLQQELSKTPSGVYDRQERAPVPQKGGGPAEQPSAQPEAAGAQEVPSVQGENRGGEQPPEVRPSEGTPAGPVALPAGNGPSPVRGLPSEVGGEPSGVESQPVAGDQGAPGGVRRVTGSADIPITPAGEKQASELAKKAIKPFDYVISGSDQRFLDTAKKFTDEPATEDALNGWGRGEHEGKPTDDVKAEIHDLMVNPDQKPPGVSPISGEPGQSFNEFKKPLLAEVKQTQDNLGPKDRALVVTSGGGLQAIDAWIKAGKPENFDFDHAEMAKQPYWSATGKMFEETPTGLKPVQDNDKAGQVYFTEHGATEFNPPKTGAGKSTVDEPKPRILQPVEIPQAKDLRTEERAAETRYIEKIQADPGAVVAEYRKKNTLPNGSLDINTDNARELSPDYSQSNAARTLYARAVHEPSSFVAKRVYDEALKEPAPKGMSDSVLFTGGGTGAGKSVSVGSINPDNPPQIIYDTNLNNFGSAKAKIDQALAAGKDVDIRYVHREIGPAFDSMLHRAMTKGRPVPIENHIETHVGAPKTLLQLEDAYKGNPAVDIKVIDNTGTSPADAHFTSSDMLRDLDYTGVRGSLERAADEAYADGRISAEVYKSVVGRSPEAAKISGRGVTEQPAAQPVQGARGPGSGTRYGRPTEILIPGSQDAYRALYSVRELEDVQASHSGQTFQANPKYEAVNDRDYSDKRNSGRILEQAGDFKPQYLLTDSPDALNGAPIIDSRGNVLGGNSRTMTLDRVYGTKPDASAKYRQMLADKSAIFGIDPAALKDMKNPVLVRELQGEYRPQKAITDFNVAGTASLTPAERAVSDSHRVSLKTLDNIATRIESQGPDGTLAKALGGDGQSLVNRLIDDGAVASQDKPALLNPDGTFSAEGKSRLSRLLIGRLFEDSKQFDTTAPELRNKLERIVAPLARVEGRGEWDIGPSVKQAINLVNESKVRDLPIDDLISQRSMFDENEYPKQSVALAKALEDKPKGLAQSFRKYAQDAEMATSGADTGLDTRLLNSKIPTQGEAFDDAFGTDLAKEHDYSSTQVNLPSDVAGKVKAAGAKIPDEELDEKGREEEPHITVLYGTHTDVPEPVSKVLKNEGPIKAKLGAMSIFPGKNGDPDVVKMDVDSTDLRRLNAKIKNALPNTNNYPNYKPHVTIAYVKPGEGAKYAGRVVTGLSGKTVTFDSVHFSPRDGEKTEIPLNGRELAKAG